MGGFLADGTPKKQKFSGYKGGKGSPKTHAFSGFKIVEDAIDEGLYGLDIETIDYSKLELKMANHMDKSGDDHMGDALSYAHGDASNALKTTMTMDKLKAAAKLMNIPKVTFKMDPDDLKKHHENEKKLIWGHHHTNGDIGKSLHNPLPGGEAFQYPTGTVTGRLSAGYPQKSNTPRDLLFGALREVVNG